MTSPASSIHRLRNWLRSDMLTLRWVLLGLYLAFLLGFVILAVVSNDVSSVFTIIIPLILSQALFIFGSGTIHLCKPIRKRRLWMPVLAASFMLMLLLAGLVLALGELFKMDQHRGLGWAMVSVVLLGWIGWGVLLWTYTRRWDRIHVLRRLAVLCFAGSLAELLAAVPSHVIVSRRPGCLVGVNTMIGIIAGLYVMLFSFGPGIVLLFLRPRYRRERMEGRALCPNCDYDLRIRTGPTCPECGMTLTMSAPASESTGS